MHASRSVSPHHARLFALAGCWLLAGSALLLTTLVPAHTAMLGWTPIFWLLAAPLLVLLATAPRRPRRVLSRRGARRRRAVVAAIWN